MDPNETLRLMRKAIKTARSPATSSSDTVSALWDVSDYADELDNWLSVGGALPDNWREDRASSASRQHYIDTGRYLTREDYAEDYRTPGA